MSHKRGEPREVVCLECGKKFVSTDGRKKFCSRTCSRKACHRKWQDDRRAKNRERVIDCAICGKPFKPYTGPNGGGGRHDVCPSCKDMSSRLRQSHTFERGLTPEKMRVVDYAQDSGDFSSVPSWTPAMTRYARKRYEYIHGLFRSNYER